MQNIEKYLVVKDQDGNNIPLSYEKKDNCYTVKINKENLKNVETLDFTPKLFDAKTGDEGYFIYSTGREYQTFFTERDDVHYESDALRVPVLGAVINGKATVMIVTKMAFSYKTVVGKKGDKYYLYPRFQVGLNPYLCDIEAKIYKMQDGSDYNDMAKLYRDYLFTQGAEPIKERKKQYPALDYSKDAPAIRIRMGWKPCPSQVKHQNEENEPGMYVACTFDDVKLFIDKLLQKGVDKAEICLVGWNKGGHDGRWPQAFPVEEKLGGEEKLRELIKYSQSKNIAIICHTGSFDGYEIADNFSMDLTVKDKCGKVPTNNVWSGGLAHVMCQKATLSITKQTIDKVAELGFCGLHYIDVFTAISLEPCFDKKHPCSTEEIIEIYNSIAKHCKDKLGGFSSEGGIMYIPQNTDFVLFAARYAEPSCLHDREIPFWMIALNGVVMQNPLCSTTNCPMQPIEKQLTLVEHNGRPVFYCNQKFMENTPWGKGDLTIDTDEKREYAALIISKGYNEYKERSYLQEEFMIQFDFLEENVKRAVFSDGSEIIVNYRNEDYTYNNITIEKMSYRLFERGRI